jgi:hypothetical protein
MQPLVFRSRVDAWLGAILIGAIVVAVTAAIMAAWEGGRAAMALVPLILLGCVLPVWVMLTTDYTLTETELRIRSGPFRWRVPLQDVRSITPTRNPLSSPALSLDRLRVEYGRSQWLMISPGDKERFLRELNARRAALGKHG